MRFRSSPGLLIISLFALVALFLLSGCVYLRLLELKGQLKDFDQNFQASTKDGIVITLLHPVLLSDDVRWLGLEPEKVTRQRDGLERWDIRWVKEVPVTVKEEAVWDIRVTTFFQDDRLVRVAIPDIYFTYFPKELFVKLLRSAGTAKINKATKAADINANEAGDLDRFQVPTLGSVEQMLGTPSAREVAGNEVTYRYRYSPVTPNGKGKVIGVTFVFAQDSGRLQKLLGKLPTGSLYFDFAGETKAEPAK